MLLPSVSRDLKSRTIRVGEAAIAEVSRSSRTIVQLKMFPPDFDGSLR